MILSDFCPEIVEDGQTYRFCGIWSKNRAEWHDTLFACMHYKITTIGFYDSMNAESVDYILNQTELTTIICSKDFVRKIIDMKKSGKAVRVVNAVVMDYDGSRLDEEIT